MNISLTDPLEKMTCKKVASGLYHPASEVVREGLRLLEEQDQLRDLRRKQLRKEVGVGLGPLARGEVTT